MVNANQQCCGYGVMKLSDAQGQDVSHCGSIELKNYTLTGKFKSSGAANVQSSQLNHITSSGALNMVHSVANDVFSSGAFSAVDCQRIGSIVSSGGTFLSRCREIGPITASGGFSMSASKVHGRVVLSGDKAEISDSSIENRVVSSNRIIKVVDSSIREIVLKPCKNSRWFGLFGRFSGSAQIVPQKVILAGKSCRVDQIRFEEGATGKVVLNDVVNVPKVFGGQIER